MNSPKKIVEALQTDFFGILNRLNKDQIEKAVKYLSEVYYNDGVSLISDENYDRLRETYIKQFGATNAITAVGAEVHKEKVKLPFYMGSMDKIKPDKNNLESWKRSYPGPVCISDKLDGISALLVKQAGKRALFTRGDGTTGQTIGHMLPYIQVGDIPGYEAYAVRGELIVSKANYDKVKEGKRGARQMVSGLANQKTLTAERIALLKLIEFVAYEVIVPENLKPSDQFRLLSNHSTFHTARWQQEPSVTIESLSAILSKQKDTSEYEIDGIIVAHDKPYPRIVGKNPEHAFAFKMSFAEQASVTEVIQVAWEASKNGYLKPTVQFEPINIGGAILQYASGFNARFIHDNGLGPGAFIEVIRSGDVIPYIRDVKSVSPTGPQMPEEAWHWNETNIDAILDRISGNPEVQKRVLLNFVQTMDIGGCGGGTIDKLHEAGIHTIPQLVAINTQFFEEKKVAGIGKTTAAKIVGNIEEAKAKGTLAQWAVGSGIFGRGLGIKRLEPAFAVAPPTTSPSERAVERVAELSGWSRDSAVKFVNQLPEFAAFLQATGVQTRARTPVRPNVQKHGDKYKDLVVLFTGFRSKELEEAIVREGGQVADGFGKKVNLLLIKDATVNNEKVKKARAAGLPVLTAEEFANR
jgi:NAD-dependent DNA ligase